MSNLQLYSNLMIDDKEHQPETKYYPGDFLAIRYPEYKDSRIIDMYFSEQQRIEYEDTLQCIRCGTPAGLCNCKGR